MSTPNIVAGREVGLLAKIEKQKELIRLGQFQRFGKLDALCFEVTATSNPKMLELGKVKTPQGQQAWPGKNLDWLGHGPPIAWTADGQLVFPAYPFPLPPPCPDPEFEWKKEGDFPAMIPQRIEDRAVKIARTHILCIQPVSSIQWMLDLATPGRARREIHEVRADGQGLHMAFLLDVDARTAHLVGGIVL